jgi:hypothetical protein
MHLSSPSPRGLGIDKGLGADNDMGLVYYASMEHPCTIALCGIGIVGIDRDVGRENFQRE